MYVWEAANLFCGDHDPSASKHLTLQELKLPDLEEMFQEHHAGGSMLQTEHSVGVKKLEPTFNLMGFDPSLVASFGLSSRRSNTYTAYQVFRDKRSGRAIENKAIIRGRLGKASAAAGKRGELQGAEYAINEVTRYELVFDGKQLLLWDFYANIWRVNGQDENAEVNRILRIPGAG